MVRSGNSRSQGAYFSGAILRMIRRFNATLFKVVFEAPGHVSARALESRGRGCRIGSVRVSLDTDLVS